MDCPTLFHVTVVPTFTVSWAGSKKWSPSSMSAVAGVAVGAAVAAAVGAAGAVVDAGAAVVVGAVWGGAPPHAAIKGSSTHTTAMRRLPADLTK